MTEVVREFYRLPDFAHEMGVDIETVLQMAAVGNLLLSYHFSGKYKGIMCGPNDDPENLDIEGTIDELMCGPDRYHSGYVNLYRAEAREVAANYNDPERTYSNRFVWTLKGNTILLSEIYQYKNSDLLVLIDEVERVKSGFRGLRSNDGHNQKAQCDQTSQCNDEIVEGHIGIAGFLGVSDRRAKDYARMKGFPIHKRTNGRVYAFEPELDVWWARYKKQ